MSSASFHFHTAVLLYRESDLQHASFWLKHQDVDREATLNSFQQCWR